MSVAASVAFGRLSVWRHDFVQAEVAGAFGRWIWRYGLAGSAV